MACEGTLAARHALKIESIMTGPAGQQAACISRCCELEGIGARQCVKCHDGDNDPHFKTDGDIFEEYWKKIVHPWRD